LKDFKGPLIQFGHRRSVATDKEQRRQQEGPRQEESARCAPQHGHEAASALGNPYTPAPYPVWASLSSSVRDRWEMSQVHRS
jgi:hypothetical protein